MKYHLSNTIVVVVVDVVVVDNRCGTKDVLVVVVVVVVDVEVYLQLTKAIQSFL